MFLYKTFILFIINKIKKITFVMKCVRWLEFENNFVSFNFSSKTPKKSLFIKQIFFFTCFVKMGRKIVLIFSHLVNLKYNCIVAELLIGFFLQNRRSNCIELSIMHKVPKLQIASFKTF